MSDYTISVYELERNGFDFGLDKYPIFNEEYRPILNDAILSYYRFREIGFQNPALWRERLQQRMSLIMRNKYNRLYEIKQIEFNPLYNVEMKETYTHELSSDNKAVQKNILDMVTDNKIKQKNIIDNNQKTIDSTSHSVDAVAFTSSFPSDELLENDLSNNLYADNANNQKNNEKINVDNTVNTTNIEDIETDNTLNTTNTEDTQADMNTTVTESYTKFTEGSSAGLPFSRAMIQLKEYLDKFELDQLVINELKDLFMTVW